MKSDCFILLLIASLFSVTAFGQNTNPAPARKAPPSPPPLPNLVPPPPPSIPLFDGKTLKNWTETKFGGTGSVAVENGEIRIDMGSELTGINWTNAGRLPETNYEISLEAMRRDGTDFFCGLTFPVETNFCTLIVGGWGGGLVGISSIDGMDASENDTTKFRSFDKNQWYKIRVRVTPEKITTWIDDEQVIDVEIKGRKISMRFGDIDLSAPLGIATWQTSASIKNIRMKRIQAQLTPPALR
ncbi:MAG: DUF1080 domain-containing protein [Verrucomicrobia bacterium]|nr:DUF1080 domain-containing protein [Verrucomicrobiota bacterium]